MMPLPADLLAAFMIGLLGSGHCFAMCGGIAGALAMRAAGHGGATLGGAALAMPLYSVGRIGAYALLGATAGAIGSLATELIPAALAVLRTLAGVLLVLMGIYLAGLWNGLRGLERLGGRLFARLRPLAAGASGPLEPLALGAVWGLLPCGLVYGALAWTLAHASIVQGGLLMTAFGLGTLPAVLVAGLAGLPLGRALGHPLVRRGAGALLVVFGLWTLAFSGAAQAAHGHGDAESSPRDGANRTMTSHGPNHGLGGAP
ncbi:MAG TPA: sulfite exporter TauE/SafE family protein [Pseudomonadales bacterium]|nr:sulfite exporter TauE/SafE family protein [Pseudomonadales bacterium]